MLNSALVLASASVRYVGNRVPFHTQTMTKEIAEKKNNLRQKTNTASIGNRAWRDESRKLK